MAVKIRLARGGAKKRPYYRIVVANATAPRDGAFIEKVGTYNPLLAHDNAERITLKQERISYWLSQGAKPTERVALFLQSAGIELPQSVKKELEIKLQSRKPKAPKKEAAA
ncbi:MAG: rpsP [Rickettsiaceae bacterium]|jgi:small subunit ribosomal protein S16|nr:rpsP [Rickettsiaceae bacterium]